MADEPGAADVVSRKSYYSCGAEKPIDQFWSKRGPRRIVFNCADCRHRNKQQASLSVLSSSIALLTVEMRSLRAL
ncbi:hypothetical protein QBC40DRAFT_283506 [Triangularia verruculosa]|uniref:Uncharacterized protein n=1 Tax=Triangularia verruculosa TaxID=2587418 RepID=A0AAN7ATG9_9PEZI|nr:hypothetical protein QBC40DRAFT_283506 [Triangularia verruculosa]